MAVEIERKYLVDIGKWNKPDNCDKHFYRQGYILTEPEKTIRVRVTDDNGFITIKGKPVGASRSEYEYSIPRQDATELLDKFCASVVSKFRYKVPFAGKVWEVDEFLEANEGLIVAEIELTSEDETFERPEWISEEVTGIEKYYNSNLSKHPFKHWH
ncbi:MAG: CYTH domain-containing protein [Williamsia sp.]|nr:CYTH domain-containing protein [Williamsia sp.]